MTEGRRKSLNEFTTSNGMCLAAGKFSVSKGAAPVVQTYRTLRGSIEFVTPKYSDANSFSAGRVPSALVMTTSKHYGVGSKPDTAKGSVTASSHRRESVNETPPTDDEATTTTTT